ncbi:uncharacterized protein LOC141841914 [Curcuma longa]|uniref:uncharacterized protein LOC141841914 n=1 Tax=Curcuma longa TaxID=136217 RepID=UPI003D9ED25F
MPDPILACFRGGAEASASTAAMRSRTTSVYETRLALAALSWSRTVLGLSLRAVLRLDGEQEEDVGEEPLVFRIRPWLLWKRRGSRRFRFNDRHSRRRSVDFVWDLRRARFPPWGSCEPSGGFFVAVSVDGEMLLVAGDMIDEAYKKTKVQQSPACTALVSRLEHAVMGEYSGGRRSYRTRAWIGDRYREISIELGAKEKGKEMWMSVEIDGKRLLFVRRLRWKFRGSERSELDGGWIHFSWDLHNWFFQSKDRKPIPSTAGARDSVPEELGHAVFLLRFEGPQKASPQQEDNFTRNSIFRKWVTERYDRKTGLINWSGSGVDGEHRRGGRKSSTQKSNYSSSASSASSASTWSVMEWASPEEVELRRVQGFSLLVYAWKN